MKIRIGIIVAILSISMLVGLPLLRAQEPPPQPATPPAAPRAAYTACTADGSVGRCDVFSGHARELALTDEQKAFMRGEIQRTTTHFLELQWQLQDAMEALHQTMKSNSVDEQQALAQLDKVLDTGRQIKHLHFSLGIRLKNQLTTAQRGKLRGMRMAPPPGGQPGPGGQL